jgi:hypothetical protein
MHGAFPSILKSRRIRSSISRARAETCVRASHHREGQHAGLVDITPPDHTGAASRRARARVCADHKFAASRRARLEAGSAGGGPLADGGDTRWGSTRPRHSHGTAVLGTRRGRTRKDAHGCARVGRRSMAHAARALTASSGASSPAHCAQGWPDPDALSATPSPGKPGPPRACRWRSQRNHSSGGPAARGPLPPAAASRLRLSLAASRHLGASRHRPTGDEHHAAR